MKKIKQYNRYFIFVFLTIFTLGQLICAFILLVDIQDVLKMLKNISNNEPIYPIVQYFVSLFITIAGFLSGLIGLIKHYKNKPSYKVIIVCVNHLVLMLLYYIVYSATEMMMAEEHNIKITNDILALLISAGVGLLAYCVSVSRSISKKGSAIIKSIFAFIGGICLFICGCSIITNPSSFDKTFGALSLILSVFGLIIFIISLINSDKETKNEAVINTNFEDKFEVGSNEILTDKNAYDSLLELKSLYEKGAITEQEYMEQKSKYISKL